MLWLELKSDHKTKSFFVNSALFQASFDDTNLLTYEDKRFSYGEIRGISLGKFLLTTQQKAIIAIVVHTNRDGKTRLISARKASKKEKKLYEQQSI